MNAIERVKKAIEEIRNGNIVIMIDDEDRENEGDLVYAGAFSTPEKVNFLAKEARGLICVAVNREIASRLELTPMVNSNTSSYETAFTISVDAKEATTGISAYERDLTIKLLSSSTSQSDDLVRPGHIFPLIAKDGGVLVRTGHTEGSVDLCKLAGVAQSGVICEIMNEDGTMARRDDLDIFAKKHNLHTVFISDLVEYRLQYESLIKRVSQKEKNFFGIDFKEIEYQDHLGHIHTALLNNPSSTTNVKFYKIEKNINILLDEVKLKEYLEVVEYVKFNSGIILFLDSQSNEKEREFGIGAQILKDLKVENINLISKHKDNEFLGLKGFGLNINKIISL